jgi:hypothetical protein
MKKPLGVMEQSIAYLSAKHPYYSETGLVLQLIAGMLDTIVASDHALALNRDLAHHDYEEIARLDLITQERAYSLA